MATWMEKKNEILDRIAQLGTLRRGQLSEQYYKNEEGNSASNIIKRRMPKEK